jgi:uncharacterized protein YcfJ
MKYIKYTTLTMVLLTATGCSSLSGGTNGAMLGAGIGALAGQAIGHDTKSTLIGTGVGALAGSIFGNEAEHQATRKREQFRNHDDWTTRRSTTRRVLDENGNVVTVGEETTTSESRESGYTGLPN